jgi:hypothetical protein
MSYSRRGGSAPGFAGVGDSCAFCDRDPDPELAPPRSAVPVAFSACSEELAAGRPLRPLRERSESPTIPRRPYPVARHRNQLPCSFHHAKARP